MIAWMFVTAAMAADLRGRAIAEALTFEHRHKVREMVANDLDLEEAELDAVLWRWALGSDVPLARLATKHLSTTADLTDHLTDVFTLLENAQADPAWSAEAARAFDQISDRSPELRDALRAYVRVSANDRLNASLLTTRAWAGEVGADARALQRLLAREDRPLTQAAAAELAARGRQPSAFPVMIMILRKGGPGLVPLLIALSQREFPPRVFNALIPHLRRIKLDRRLPRDTRILADNALFRLRGGAETPHPRQTLSPAWEQPFGQTYRQLRATAVGLLDHPRAACARLLGRR